MYRIRLKEQIPNKGMLARPVYKVRFTLERWPEYRVEIEERTFYEKRGQWKDKASQ